MHHCTQRPTYSSLGGLSLEAVCSMYRGAPTSSQTGGRLCAKGQREVSDASKGAHGPFDGRTDLMVKSINLPPSSLIRTGAKHFTTRSSFIIAAMHAQRPARDLADAFDDLAPGRTTRSRRSVGSYILTACVSPLHVAPPSTEHQRAQLVI